MDDIAHMVACACCGELKKGSEIARTERPDSPLFRVLEPDSPVVVPRTTTSDGGLRVCAYCYNNGLKKGKRPRRAFHFPPKDTRLTAGRNPYGGHSSPHHPAHFEPWLHELNGTL